MGGAGGLSTEMKRAAQEDATVSAPVLDFSKDLSKCAPLWKFGSDKD